MDKTKQSTGTKDRSRQIKEEYQYNEVWKLEKYELEASRIKSEKSKAAARRKVTSAF